MRKHTHQVIFLTRGDFVWGSWQTGRTHESRKAAEDNAKRVLETDPERYVGYRILPLLKCK